MRLAKRLLPGVWLAGLLLLGGCGKKEEQPTRFNRTLGSTPVGVPVAAAPVDTGILRDPKDYEPTPYEPLGGAAPGPAASGGGPEVEAIRAVLQRLLEASFQLDVSAVLDSFVPEEVAVLRQDDYMSTLYETKDTIDAYWKVFQSKATGPELELIIRMWKLVPQLGQPLLNAITITVEDQENAVATLHGERFELPEDTQTAVDEVLAGLGALRAQMGAAGLLGGPAPGAAEPGAAGPAPGTPAGELSWETIREELAGKQISVRLRKVDEGWRLALPFTLQEEQADLLNEGLLLLKDYFAAVTAAYYQVETLDLQTAQQIDMREQGKVLAFLGWMARAKAMLEAMTETGPGEEGAEETEAEEQRPADPNAAESREAPPGRGRVP
jgi:hypothetical protein